MHKSQKPTVVIIVDHPIRDLGGCTLIATELAKNGVRAILVPMAFQEEGAFLFAPDLVLVNYIRNNNFQFIQKLYASGIKVSLLDTEGGFYGDLSKYTKVLCQTNGILEKLDQIFVWGHAMNTYWRETIKVKPDQIKLTGVARFDMYHPEILKQLKFKSNSKLPNKKVILFNTKVALANPQFQSVKKEKALYLKLGFSTEEIETIYSQGLQYIERLSQLVANSSSRYPDQSIVVRPHPHENLKTYQNRLASFSNVNVNREGDFLNWLPLSQAIVHRHCTTAIEGALAGIPAISPQWIPTSSNLPDGEALSYRPQSEDEFFELFSSASKNQLPVPNYAKPILEKTISDWLFQFDGNSHVRIANQVLLSLAKKSTTSVETCAGYIREAYKNRTDFTGKLMNFSESNRLTSSFLRKLKVLKWKNTAKSFNQEQTQDFILSPQNVKNFTQDDIYIVFE